MVLLRCEQEMQEEGVVCFFHVNSHLKNSSLSLENFWTFPSNKKKKMQNLEYLNLQISNVKYGDTRDETVFDLLSFLRVANLFICS